MTMRQAWTAVVVLVAVTALAALGVGAACVARGKFTLAAVNGVSLAVLVATLVYGWKQRARWS